jgi:predicted PurR-regulated permease PerM
MQTWIQNQKQILALAIYFLFALLFWPFKTPLLFAALVAFALNPVIVKLKNKIPTVKSHKKIVVGLLLVVLFAFFVPLSILIFKAIAQIKNLQNAGLDQLSIYKNFSDLSATANTWLQDISSQFGVDIASYLDLNSIFSKISDVVIPALTGFVTNLPSFIFNFLVFIFALYFILLYASYFKKWFYGLNIFSNFQIDRLSSLIQKVCNLVLISTVIVASAQALIISVACLFAGYTDFLILFMVAFFMSFIPVIGSAPVSVGLIIYSFMNGNITAAIILIIAALIAASIDNVIKTYMLTGNGTSGTHPFVSLLSLIGALSLFGFAGLFLGPIITELAFQIGDILIDTNELGEPAEFAQGDEVSK